MIVIDSVFDAVINQIQHTEPIIPDSFVTILDPLHPDHEERILLCSWIPDEFAEYSMDLYTTLDDIQRSIQTDVMNCKLTLETRHFAYGLHNIGYVDERDGVITTSIKNVCEVVEDVLMIFGLDYYNDHKQHLVVVGIDDIKESMCSVCLEPWNKDTPTTINQLSVCKHAFCNTCITDWMIRKKTCPLCRAII